MPKTVITGSKELLTPQGLHLKLWLWNNSFKYVNRQFTAHVRIILQCYRVFMSRDYFVSLALKSCINNRHRENTHLFKLTGVCKRFDNPLKALYQYLIPVHCFSCLWFGTVNFMHCVYLMFNHKFKCTVERNWFLLLI